MPGQNVLFVANKQDTATKPPTLPTVFREIERWANGLQFGGGTPAAAPLPYTFSGPLVASTSPRVTPHVTTTFTGFSANLTTPGSTSTSIELLVDNVVVATVVLAAGAHYGWTSLSATLAARTDFYTVAISAVGTGAVDLGGEIEVG